MSSSRIGRDLPGAIRSLAPGVAGTMLVSVGVLAAARRLLPQQDLMANRDIVGNYLQTLGTIYAVLLAFVVYVVWTEYTELRKNLGLEASELFDLLRVSNGLPNPVARQVRDLVRQYVDTLLQVEWPALAREDTGPLEQGWDTLDELWKVLRRYEPADERCNTLYSAALGSLKSLSDTRTARIDAGQSRIPLPLRILLYTGAVSTVGSLCLFGVEHFWIHALIMALLSGAVAHVLVVIEDLDDPFEGYWQAPRDPFRRLLAYANELERASKPPT